MLSAYLETTSDRPSACDQLSAEYTVCEILVKFSVEVLLSVFKRVVGQARVS